MNELISAITQHGAAFLAAVILTSPVTWQLSVHFNERTVDALNAQNALLEKQLADQKSQNISLEKQLTDKKAHVEFLEKRLEQCKLESCSVCPSLPCNCSGDIDSSWPVNMKGGSIGVKGAKAEADGTISFPVKTETNFSYINKLSILVPEGAKKVVVQIVKGNFPKIAFEGSSGQKLDFEEVITQPYPDYAEGAVGKHVFILSNEYTTKMPQAQLMFAPGIIEAGSALKVYFIK